MIEIKHGNILAEKATAIVNPANVSLLHGSGLCGLIHRQAGRELEAHCKTLGRGDFGEIVITPSFQLTPFEFIIHACGPRWMDGNRGEAATLARLYQNLFKGCLAAGIQSVAVPAISTGIYRFPLREATEIALTEAMQYQHNPDLHIMFVNLEADKHEVYVAVYASLQNRN
jgi:O-acetyl-ADP-ribose deacetylase (regulator of RNase III)